MDFFYHFGPDFDGFWLFTACCVLGKSLAKITPHDFGVLRASGRIRQTLFVKPRFPGLEIPGSHGPNNYKDAKR
jgi:hypothetical protein